ncbi:MAG: hypothetical protein AUH29_04550 [Candidatus Rokubacteria bacterium 13_1_40CM_69_27]|nr:MAG: hypothetical protein AUH29_04550 [Candidatus Rokubacteria bacterium 13_1_40CM_69_27]OLC32930.1 MAG: hypothetical protein AUH81_15120 [Candidatus Rokubacteria bacterium 13_1_40CM_4_69_5]
MKPVGRNDPCPCGSGKKYKRCCLDRAGSVGAYTGAEREAALDGLFRFAARAGLEEERATADLAFWGELADELSADELKEAMSLEQSQLGFQEWYVFDLALSDGRTFLERYLERAQHRLRSGELRFLERMRRSHIRPYEVRAVRPEEGLELLDLWTRRRLRVRERLATRRLARWDVLSARVILDSRGEPVVEGSPYLYPPEAQDELLKLLRRAYRAFCREFPRESLTAFFKRMPILYHRFWLDTVALVPDPRLVTAEGDDIVLARVVFDVRDRGVVEAVLARHTDFARQDDGSYVWLEAEEAGRKRPSRRAANAIQLTSMRLGGGTEPRRSLGTVVPEGNRLVFEAISKRRAERGRAMIEALAGGAVAHRATSYEDVDQALKRRPKPAVKRSEIPAAMEAKLLAEFYEQHYGKWLDEPLPALGGRTPRQAAASKSGRPKVIALLKHMDNLAERQRQEGLAAYDFGWMWAELGLDRPG